MKRCAFATLCILCTVLILISCDKDDNTDEPIVITASGNIQSAIDEYRALLGPNNAGVAGEQTTGRREINWDGVPDEFAQPYDYPPDFFNTNVNNRARGAVFTTPGSALGVSADSDNPTGTPMSFGNINPAYSEIFPPFSGERIFSPLGSNVVDLQFFVPGTNTPAVVHGFGAVYIDVDRMENTAFEYFDVNDKSLGTYGTPKLDAGHVFLGVYFNKPIVHRVRIEYGNSALGPDDGGSIDVAVMDDFIYGEPHPAQ